MYAEGVGLLTSQESWCPELCAGSWLITVGRYVHCALMGGGLILVRTKLSMGDCKDCLCTSCRVKEKFVVLGYFVRMAINIMLVQFKSSMYIYMLRFVYEICSKTTTTSPDQSK